MLLASVDTLSVVASTNLHIHCACNRTTIQLKTAQGHTVTREVAIKLPQLSS